MTDDHSRTPAQLSDLTLAEKAALVSGASFWQTAAIPDKGVPAAVLSDGPHGVRYQDEASDHLGFNHSIPATAYPTAAATACSWDRGLLRAIGTQLGHEARAIGVDVLLGPGMNIKRSPLCGRNFEYFSEDPLLTGELAVAWVDGIQRTGVGASVKHFAVNNQETDRMRISAEVDERTLREIYLRAFERVVTRSQPATVMASYNVLNGVKVAENEWLLDTVLRGEWGYEGVVVSDWGAVSDPVASLRAGLDLEMPTTAGASAAAIVRAVESGEIDEGVLDRSVERVLRMGATHTSTADKPAFDADAGHQLAFTAAVESAVLLSNDGTLPLSPDAGGTVAVIGEFARSPRYQGAGSSHVVPHRLDTALDAARDRLAGRREVTFAPGFTFEGADQALADEAVEVARAAGDVILFLGLPDADESEGFDREHLSLPEAQLELFHRLAEVTDRLVVVLSHGAVVEVATWEDRAAATLDMWLGGQASGSAAVALLFGDANPSGKLAETVPLRLEDTPAYLNWPGSDHVVHYGERIYVGYRSYDRTRRDVAHAFGHGLSYTTFEYGELEARADDDGLHLAVSVTNTGARDGAEVVQFYAEAPGDDRPTRELIGFEKVRLRAGAREIVRATVPWGDVSFFSTREHRWVRAGGRYRIWAAASSRDLRSSTEIDIEGTEAPVILDLESSFGEWLADPRGSQALQELFAETGQAPSVDESMMPLIGPIPLGKMLGMMMAGSAVVDPARLEELVARVNG